MNPIRYIFIIPESHEHLGLLDDLSIREDVSVFVARPRKENGIKKGLQKVALGGTVNQIVPMPFQDKWFRKFPFPDFDDRGHEYCIVIFDGALRALSVPFLNRVQLRPNVRLVLAMINAMRAQSTVMPQIRKKIRQVHWSDVYTFDPGDAEKYHWKSLKNEYYSLHQDFMGQHEAENDLYFAGGIKGGREELLLRLYGTARANSVQTDFHFHLGGFEKRKADAYPEGIHVETGAWRSYEKILAETVRTNTILEVLQEGQTGPSLRYYEAVCYNKKLLTTNKSVAALPCYNPRYMQVIHSPADVDWAWVKRRENVDYHYNGRFSPLHLLDTVLV